MDAGKEQAMSDKLKTPEQMARIVGETDDREDRTALLGEWLYKARIEAYDKGRTDGVRVTEEAARQTPAPEGGKVDQWWCYECSSLVKENHRCEQWANVTRIPAEAINALSRHAKED
jgi:hypothetical protein